MDMVVCILAVELVGMLVQAVREVAKTLAIMLVTRHAKEAVMVLAKEDVKELVLQVVVVVHTIVFNTFLA